MTDDRYTDEEAAAAMRWARQYGPANCWTGSTGTAATKILRLVKERARLVGEVALWQAVASLQPKEREHLAAAIDDAGQANNAERARWLRILLERLA